MTRHYVPHKGDWYMDRDIYIRIGNVDPDGNWAMIHCHIMRLSTSSFNKPFMQTWAKQQPTPDGIPDWKPLDSPPAEILEALTWPQDGRGYYGPKPR